MATETFRRFDAANYLTDIETAAAYLQATIDESGDDPGAIADALAGAGSIGAQPAISSRQVLATSATWRQGGV